MAFRKIVESCSKVIAGDEAEEHALGMQPITVSLLTFNINQTEVQLQHNVLSQIAAAGEALGLSILRDTASTGLSLLNSINKSAFKTDLQPISMQPSDYAETIQAVLLEVDNRASKLEKQLERAISISDEEDEAADSEGVSIVDVKKSDVVDVCAGGSAEGDVSAEGGGSDSVKVSGGAVGNPLGADKVDDKLSVSGATEEAASSCKESPIFTPYVGKSHNKRRVCPLCNFNGVHLSRHLATAHQEKAESAPERARIVYQADESYRKSLGQSSTLTNKQERLYQCGLPGCHAIVSRMSQHLRRGHKITKPGALAVAKRSFQRLSSKHPSKHHPEASKKSGTGKEAQSQLFRPKKVFIKGQKSLSSSSPPQPAKNRRKRVIISDSETTSEEEADISYDDDSDDSLESSVNDDCGEQVILPEGGVKWAEFYKDLKSRDATIRGHFVSTFFRYLLHVEGGCHSEEQGLIQTWQVNLILDAIDPKGDDLNCLVCNDGLNVWDKCLGPKLTSKELTGNTLKVYIRSLELFISFIKKNLFYDKSLLSPADKDAIVSLLHRLPAYRATIHRRTANETTTHKVNDCLMKIRPEDIRNFESSNFSKGAVKLLGEAIHHRPLTKSEFTTVRDYLLVTAIYENGSRPGPLENAKLLRFQQAEYVTDKNRWAIVVDEHKTTRHQGPAEIVMDERLYGYTKLYVEHLHPCFVASGEDHLFIKEDGHGFRKGTIGRRVGEVFKKAGVRGDVTVTATKIRKLFSSGAAELSPTKKKGHKQPHEAQRNHR